MKGSPRSEGSHPPFLWTRGIAAREVLHQLDRNGIDAEPLLAEAELSRSQVTQELGGISFVAQQRFLELAAVKTNDSLIGLHTAAEMDLRDAGILFYLAASSPTVAEALDHLVRYSGAESEAVRLEISRQQPETVLTARPVFAFEEFGRQFSEFTALALVRILRSLTNRDFAPRRITFCPQPELQAEGAPRHTAMPGRICTDRRQLGIAAKRHRAADNFQ